MSNHFSADKLKFPGDDRRLDLTDVFVFQSVENRDRTVLIVDSNPTSSPPPIPAPTIGPEFHPDAVRAIEIAAAAPAAGEVQRPVTVFDEGGVRVTAVQVTHGHVIPALAYHFDTPDRSVVSGDTTVNHDLIGLARGADILVHSVADLGYLERHGTTGAELRHMAGLHTDVTDVGDVAEQAHVDEFVLTHYLPAESHAISESAWAARAGRNFSGRTIAGRDGLRRVLPRASG